MTLEELRKEIDKIDTEIFNLLIKRLGFVKKVGQVKKSTESARSIIRPAREANMLRDIYKRSKAQSLPENIAKGFSVIWRQIISVSINYEEKTNISYLKGDNIFYAKEYFGSFSDYTECKTNEKIFGNIKSGKSNIAIFPLNKNEKDRPWWLEMAENHYDYSLFAGFPFFEDKEITSIAISNITPEPSGNDIFVYVLKGKLPKVMEDNFDIISECKEGYLLFSDEHYNEYSSKINLKYIGCFAKF